MSIAVSEVETRVRKITRRDNTTDLTTADLDILILEACIEIAQYCLCLKSSVTGTLLGDGTSITAPADMVKADSAIDEFYLDTTLLDRITFAEWRAGKQDGYCYHDGTIYITPTSSNDRAYTLYYRTIHSALSTNLEFEDDLKMAVVWLTAKKVYDNFELFDQSNTAFNNYQREIAINAPTEVVVCRLRTTRE